jgi:hypothetical protein
VDLSAAEWHKSTYSSDNGWIEVACVGGEAVAVRDSKNRQGPALVFTRVEWEQFVDGVRNGAFNFPYSSPLSPPEESPSTQMLSRREDGGDGPKDAQVQQKDPESTLRRQVREEARDFSQTLFMYALFVLKIVADSSLVLAWAWLKAFADPRLEHLMAHVSGRWFLIAVQDAFEVVILILILVWLVRDILRMILVWLIPDITSLIHRSRDRTDTNKS